MLVVNSGGRTGEESHMGGLGWRCRPDQHNHHNDDAKDNDDAKHNDDDAKDNYDDAKGILDKIIAKKWSLQWWH